MLRSKKNGILIVGAGPTGMALAHMLSDNNVPFTIIDSKKTINSSSKGLAINILSQYYFNKFGINDIKSKNGCLINRLNIYWEGKRYSSLNFNFLETTINRIITQPQSDTEKKIESGLMKKGITVRWNTELQEMRDHGDKVVVQLSNKSNNITTESYDFVIGCDGKNSIVRKSIAGEMEGFDYDMHFVLADYSIALELNSNEVHYHVYQNTFIIFVPIGKDKWRIVVKYDGPVPVKNVQTFDIENIVEKYFSNTVKLPKPSWISRAPFYYRISNKLAVGNVAIAGDAAHLFSPIGGTGMNTGIQDAINLGWRLSFQYKNKNYFECLKNYEIERLSAIKIIASATDLSTKAICNPAENEKFIKSISPVFNNRHKLKKLLPSSFSGILSFFSNNGKECKLDQQYIENYLLPRKRIDSHYSIVVNKYSKENSKHLTHLLKKFDFIHLYTNSPEIKLHPNRHTISELKIGIDDLKFKIVRPDGFLLGFYDLVDIFKIKKIIINDISGDKY